MFPIFSSQSMLYKCVSAQNNLIDFLFQIQKEIFTSREGILLVFLFLNLFCVVMISRDISKNFFLLIGNEENMSIIHSQNYEQYRSLDEQIKSVSKDMKKIKRLQYVK